MTETGDPQVMTVDSILWVLRRCWKGRRRSTIRWVWEEDEAVRGNLERGPGHGYKAWDRHQRRRKG